jgi:hypothetical protein
MRKQLILISGIIICFLPARIKGQATNPNNIRVPAAFLGWNGAGPFSGPLDIRNDFNNQIRLFTNNSERLRVFEFGVSPSCPTGGEAIF